MVIIVCATAIVVCAMICYSWIVTTNIKAKCGDNSESDCVGFEHPEPEYEEEDEE